MTNNPFEALGGAGGFDMNALLQQAQQMQEQLAAAQERLADADARRDDLDADPDNLGGEDLLARELGASMIEEIKHS